MLLLWRLPANRPQILFAADLPMSTIAVASRRHSPSFYRVDIRFLGGFPTGMFPAMGGNGREIEMLRDMKSLFVRHAFPSCPPSDAHRRVSGSDPLRMLSHHYLSLWFRIASLLS